MKLTIAKTTGIALLFAFNASAATVQFDPSYSSPYTVDRTVDGGVSWYAQDPGQFHFSLLSSSNTLPTSFYSFCIEPREFISPGQIVDYTEAPLSQGATNINGMGLAKANLLLELFGRNDQNLAPVDALHGAAIQAAVWKIVRENQQTIGAFNLGTGDVQFRNWSDTQVRDLAQSMLNGLTGTGPRTSNLEALIKVGVQDVVVQTRGLNAQVVPEPGTLLLVGSALLAAGLLRAPRRVKRARLLNN